ncbi:MAG: metallophosphoesterase [Candidatus Cyclonatronum sp.]|uniref:metallophosphoesterase n=1 Tax=Cyclonatronum sp. TaxID=3024185 RepID=UPI0025C60420|nr:metallophosphoesterase [Cyclonatronum sp.]MCH8487989.1 metallophosphoesterase [Cyclonatronum sp.]
MKIGLISDTHDHLPHIRKAMSLFRLQGVSTLLHAGDFCSPFAVPELEGFELHAVFGNNDGDAYRILMKMEGIAAEHHAEFADLTFGGRRIALYHGTQEGITEALVKCRLYDLVVSGHTHSPHIKTEGKTMWVNPGSAHGFGERATVAVYDTDAHEAVIAEL